MRVIAWKTLAAFSAGNLELKKALETWYSVAKVAKWTHFGDVRASHPKASLIAGDRVVFDILGGRYRLVVAIRYSFQIVYIRFIGTHAGYNRIDAATV